MKCASRDDAKQEARSVSELLQLWPCGRGIKEIIELVNQIFIPDGSYVGTRLIWWRGRASTGETEEKRRRVTVAHVNVLMKIHTRMWKLWLIARRPLDMTYIRISKLTLRHNFIRERTAHNEKRVDKSRRQWIMETGRKLNHKSINDRRDFTIALFYWNVFV